MADETLYQYIENTGVIVPDTSDIKSDVQEEFKDALGRAMSTSDDTPQGRLISAEVTARRAVAENNAELANQINPSLAGGVFLESICALLGIERKGASASVIAGVQLTGSPLVVIPAGSRARSSDGELYASTRTIVLDTNGTGAVDFVAVNTGALTCVVGGLTTIIDPVFGWETVYNPVAAVPGDTRQSDTELRLQRQLRLARQGISTVEAHISSLYEIEGVHSLAFLENISHEFQTIEGIYMKPHSVWACVYGGTDDDIAISLLKSKTAGAAWNGSVSIVVTEPHAGIPYTVLFDRPEEVPIQVQVVASKGQSTHDPKEVIPASMIKYAKGELDGERGFVVGMNVSPFELSGAVSLIQPGIFVRNVLISRNGETPTAAEVNILKNEVATLDINNISVIVV